MGKENWWSGIPANRNKRDSTEITSDCRRKVPLPPKVKEKAPEEQLTLPIDVEYLKPVLCPSCYGRGTQKARVCRACKGRGVVPADVGTNDVSSEV